MIFNKKNSGFTLMELTISMVIVLIIIILVVASFSLAQKTLRKSNIRAELTQNGRVAMDLMSRELRQTEEIVTTLPPDNSNPETIAHELQFEDSHTTYQIQYIRYYLSNDDLYREIIAYCFEIECPNYVHWDDQDAYGYPDPYTLENRIIGENFSSIDFYGQDNISIEMNLQKSEEEMEIKAVINPRNI